MEISFEASHETVVKHYTFLQGFNTLIVYLTALISLHFNVICICYTITLYLHIQQK